MDEQGVQLPEFAAEHDPPAGLTHAPSDMDMPAPIPRRQRRGLRRRNSWQGRSRKLLLGCLITLGILLPLLGGGWWFASRHLGQLVAGLVRTKADESINGRFEFEKLDVDLAGRALLTDASIYLNGTEIPVVTCPRAVVTLDFLNFIGPNRGRRAVVIDLYELQARVVREPGGAFNLTGLVKPREEKRESIGVSVRLHEAKLDFTDACLLDQSYPALPTQPELVAKLFKELGYSPGGPAESALHNELLTISGAVSVNPEREELAVDLRAIRAKPGGEVRVTGSAKSDGTVFDITTELEHVAVSSIADYAHALFPALQLQDATDSTAQTQPASAATGTQPRLVGDITRGRFELKKRPGAEISCTGQVALDGVDFTSASLPQVALPRLAAEFSTAPKRVSGDFTLRLLGCEITGNPSVDFASRELRGTVTLAKTELKTLMTAATDRRLTGPGRGMADKELPIKGALSAQLKLGGTLDAPKVRLIPASDKLSYGKLALGKLTGELVLDGNVLTAQGVRLAGGAAPIKLDGSLDTRTQDGRFSFSAGPLSIAEAVDLSSRIGQNAKPAKVDAQGDITLSAVAQIAAGKLSSSLQLTSKQVMLGKQSLRAVDITGRIAAPNIEITEAVATLALVEPLNAGEFKSDGPLRLGLRAGGSISTLPGSQSAITLTGKATTLNLLPTQAAVSFKVAGPLNDPQIKAQLKTAQKANPLAIALTGYYRPGWSPWKAELTWHNSKAVYTGDVDFTAQKLKGKLAADNVDLGRFSGLPEVSGTLSAAAQLGGTFSAPTLSGRVQSTRLAYAAAQRSYAVTDLGLGFKLAGKETVSVSDGKFEFEGNAFTVQGVLGRASKELTLSCQKFNLFSALALVPTTSSPDGKGRPLAVRSAGPLTVAITGDPQHPQAAVEYSSGKGNVEGHGFDSARLSATATLDSLKLSRFEIRSPQGSISATGNASFNRSKPAAPAPAKKKVGLLGLLAPRQAAAQSSAAATGTGVSSWSVQAAVDSFDVAVLTPLTGQAALKTLTGKLDGTLRASGTGKQYSADGMLKLTNGSYQGRAVSEASAELQTTGKGVEIRSGKVIAEGTVLTLSGTLAPELRNSKLSAHADSVELALANPFLPEKARQLKGPVKLDVQLSPSRGEFPSVGVQVQDIGKPVQFGELALGSVSIDASWLDGVTQIKRCSLLVQGSPLTVTGTVGKTLAEAQLKVQSDGVDLALFKPWLPANAPPLKGKAKLAVALSPSTTAYPNIDAAIDSTSGGLQVGKLNADAVSLQFQMRNSILDISKCDIHVKGSTLDAGGKLGLAELAGNGGKHDLPYDFWLKANQFDLGVLQPFLASTAVGDSLPAGNVTCDLILGGKQSAPLLSGSLAFNLTQLPQKLLPFAITGVSGDISLVKNDFDIKRIELKSSDKAGLGQAKVTGSGRLSLVPLGLISGSIDIALAPQGQFALVKYYDPRSSSQKGVFEGTLGGLISIKGGRDARPVISGQVVVNAPANVSIVRMDFPKSEGKPTSAGVMLKDLHVLIQNGTEIRYSPVEIDLQANLYGNLTLNGVPGNLNAADPDAFRIEGLLQVPKGSMQVLRHVIRLEDPTNKLEFSGKPGDLIPAFTGRGALILPRVLTGNEQLASTGQAGGISAINAGGDLKVYFNFTRIKLDPSSGALDKVVLSSEPPLAPETIRNYLLGGVESVLTGREDLGQFVESEAIGYGTGFISRIIEKQLDLNEFRVGGTGSTDNPFYMQMEKQISPDVSLTYFRNFYSQAGQNEEFGVKYNVFRSSYGQRYQNLDLRVNFQQGGMGGNNREFMFMWTTRF